MPPRPTALLHLLLAACMMMLPACGLLRKKRAPEAKGGPVGQATLIGIVEMVNPEQGYVVIRCDAPPSLQPGTELLALSAEGARSKLVLSPERKGYYLTADIKEGSPAVTHLVLLPRREEEPAASTPPPPQPPAMPPANAPQPVLPAGPLPMDPIAAPPTTAPPQAAPAPTAPAAPPPAIKLDDLEPPVGNP